MCCFLLGSGGARRRLFEVFSVLFTGACTLKTIVFEGPDRVWVFFLHAEKKPPRRSMKTGRLGPNQTGFGLGVFRASGQVCLGVEAYWELFWGSK